MKKSVYVVALILFCSQSLLNAKKPRALITAGEADETDDSGYEGDDGSDADNQALEKLLTSNH